MPEAMVVYGDAGVVDDQGAEMNAIITVKLKLDGAGGCSTTKERD